MVVWRSPRSEWSGPPWHLALKLLAGVGLGIRGVLEQDHGAHKSLHSGYTCCSNLTRMGGHPTTINWCQHSKTIISPSETTHLMLHTGVLQAHVAVGYAHTGTCQGYLMTESGNSLQ